MGTPAGSAVVCPGHGVCVDPSHPETDTSWAGIFPGEAGLLLEHVGAAVRLADELGAMLIFSGGMTRRNAGPVSEAGSYLAVAHSAGLFGCPTVSGRVLLEEYARDSLENLLFSIACFRARQGRYPQRLVIVGWRFKATRFDAHRRAIAWPDEAYAYYGVNNPAEGVPLEKALAGEEAKLAALRVDPMLTGPKWREQRRARDPFTRGHPYAKLVPELAPLLAALDAPATGAMAPSPPPWRVGA